MSPKTNIKSNTNVAKTQMVLSQNFANTQLPPKCKCCQNANVAKTQGLQAKNFPITQLLLKRKCCQTSPKYHWSTHEYHWIVPLYNWIFKFKSRNLALIFYLFFKSLGTIKICISQCQPSLLIITNHSVITDSPGIQEFICVHLHLQNATHC